MRGALVVLLVASGPNRDYQFMRTRLIERLAARAHEEARTMIACSDRRIERSGQPVREAAAGAAAASAAAVRNIAM